MHCQRSPDFMRMALVPPFAQRLGLRKGISGGPLI
jgi:hypothetical protein